MSKIFPDVSKELAKNKLKKTPLEHMRLICKDYNQGIETRHYKADQLLCSLVREFVPNGREVVKEYNNIEKWYS